MRLGMFMKPWNARLVRGLGAGLALFGLLAASGLAAKLFPEGAMPQPLAGAGLALAGLALPALASARPSLRVAGLLLALVLAGLGAGTLALAGGLFAAPAAWAQAINPHASVAFMLAGAFALALSRRWIWAAQLAMAAVFAIGWMNLLGHLIHPDLVQLGLLAANALPLGTAVALVALGLAMAATGYQAGRWQEFYRGREDRRLAAVGGLVLLLSTLSIGVVGIGFTSRAMLSVYDEAMLAQVREDIGGIHHVLRQAAADVRGQLALQAPMRAGENEKAYGQRLMAALGKERAIALRFDVPQRAVWKAGSWATDALRLPLPELEAELVWTSEPRLALQYPVALPAGGQGRIVVEVLLRQWSPSLFRNRVFGTSGETLYCARGGDGVPHCLATRFLDQPFVPPATVDGWPIPMTRALDGRAGVALAPDYRGVPVRAVHLPVMPGVGIVEKVDAAEVMAPARGWLNLSVVLILLLTSLGIWILYRGVFPLAHALRLRQRQHHAILNHAPAAVVTASEQGLIETFNAQAEKLLGFSAATAKGRPLVGLFDDASMALFLREPGTDAEHRLRCGAQRSDGSLVDVDVWLGQDVLDGRRYWIAVVNDCSEQAARQKELERWESVFMHAPWGIALGDRGGTTLSDLNPAFARMHGYEREELLGRPIVDVFALSERAKLAQRIEQAHRDGSHVYESVHLRKDGSEFPVLLDVTVVYDEAGQIDFRIGNVQDISRSREMADRLRESESIRRLVLDTQRDMVARWKPDTTILFANRAWAEIFGQSPEDIVGMRWLDLLRERGGAGGRLAEYQHLVAELNRHPRRLEHVGSVMHQDAGRLWVLWTILPLFRDDRTIEGFQVSGHDITARKAVEDALLESESWFRGVFDSMFHHAAVLDTSGNILKVNLNNIVFHGRSQSDLAGLPLWEMDGLSGSGEMQERLRRGVLLAAQGEPVRFELDARSKFGDKVVFDFSCRPILKNGKDVTHLIAEAHDITEYRDRERQLLERDARFQGISESITGIAAEFTRQGDSIRVIYINQASTAVFGIEPAAFESGEASLLECLHPEGRAELLAAVNRSERTLEELQWIGRLHYDGDVWFSFRAIPRKIGGRVVWSGVGMDITAIKEKEIEIDKSRAALRELAAHHEMVREDERKRMAREIHDELGQYLTALRMGLAVLGERAANDAATPEVVRLKGLVDESITVVRGIATTLRPAALDLGIADALSWLASEFEVNTRLRCCIHVDVKGAGLGDDVATVLFRIAQESLTNVARHADASHVWIRVQRVNRHLVMEIRDDGCGFDVQQTTRGGFGLLSMRERALMIGGDMTIDSKPGEGTVVSISISIE